MSHFHVLLIATHRNFVVSRSGFGSNVLLGRRTMSLHWTRTPAQEPRGQEENGLQESEQRRKRDAYQTKRQSDQPDDRPDNQCQDGKGPTKNEKKAPGKQCNQCLHVEFPRELGGRNTLQPRKSQRQPVCDEPAEMPDKTGILDGETPPSGRFTIRPSRRLGASA
jgi:hypothetical protein